MGPNSNIEFSPGTLYIMIYLKKTPDDAEITFTWKLSIWQRIKLFGLWPVIKSLFRRVK